MRWILLLALCGCRAPDQVTVTPGYSQTDADFSRGLDQTYEGESHGLYLGLSWDMGERRRVRNSGAEREARMETLDLAHAAHEGVVVNVPGDEEPPENGWSALTKALTALGAALAVALTAWLQMRTKKPPASEETEG